MDSSAVRIGGLQSVSLAPMLTGLPASVTTSAGSVTNRTFVPVVRLQGDDIIMTMLEALFQTLIALTFGTVVALALYIAVVCATWVIMWVRERKA